MRPLITALLLLLGGAPGAAQGLLQVRPEPATVTLAPGGTARLRLRLRVAPGWHTFPAQPQVGPEGLGPAPLEVGLPADSGLRIAGAPRTAPPKQAWDEGFHLSLATLEGETWAEVTLQADPGLPPGARTLPLTVAYQVCRNGGCRPPETLEVPLTVALQGPPEEGGLGAFLALSLLAGAGALLTPCVLPMVPLAVSLFLQRARHRGGRPLREALAFGLGIVGTFAGLGLLLSGLLGATGLQTLATHPGVNLALGALLLVFALSLFGSLDLGLPTAWTQRLGTPSGAGIWAVALMGAAFALTSFTCTMPFVGTALVAAARGQWFRPLLGMAGFATAFALPFALLALFPAALGRLPRSGAWMGRLKAVLGFVELAAALKFLANADQVMGWGLLSRPTLLAAWVACAALAGWQLLRPLPGDTEGPGGLRLVGATLAFALAVQLASGLGGHPLGPWEAYLPPTGTADPGPAQPREPAPEAGWMEDLEAARDRARREGRPLFVDFTGVTCTNCRWMERNMFPRPAVARALEGHVRVRLWTDRRRAGDLAHRRLQLERFGTVELPLYARFSPEGALLGTQAFTRDEAAFLAFLTGAP